MKADSTGSRQIQPDPSNKEGGEEKRGEARLTCPVATEMGPRVWEEPLYREISVLRSEA